MQLSHNVKGRRSLQRGFTLIELLTVIAIISLLIAIVVPGLSRARDQAKNTKTRSIMKAMGDGLELFRNENPDEVRGESYPSSAAADDPTEQGHQTIFGAQWAARYLLGKDMRGYVPKRVGKVFEPNAPQYWEQRDWYSDNATPNHPLDRVGPYLDVGQVTVRDPNSLPGSDTAGGLLFPLDAKTLEQIVILDTFEYPILYFAANAALAQRPTAPVAGFEPNSPKGIYTFSDNALFTGHCKGAMCDMAPWDFDTGQEHPLKEFGTHPNDIPDPNSLKLPANAKSFPYYILNKNVYESTQRRTAVPVRKESYILISAGKDGLYGTVDDVTNY